jgi:hypothetical protein
MVTAAGAQVKSGPGGDGLAAPRPGDGYGSIAAPAGLCCAVAVFFGVDQDGGTGAIIGQLPIG